MLAEITPAQLVDWRAAIDCLALDDAWQIGGTICETLNNKVAEVQAGMAGKESVPKECLTKAVDFIPLLRKPSDTQNTSGGMMTPDQLMQSLGAMGHKVK